MFRSRDESSVRLPLITKVSNRSNFVNNASESIHALRQVRNNFDRHLSNLDFPDDPEAKRLAREPPGAKRVTTPVARELKKQYSRRTRGEEANLESPYSVKSPAVHRSRLRLHEEAHVERQKQGEYVTSPAAHRSRRRRDEEAHFERERESENVTSPAAHRSRQRRDEEAHSERERERENVTSPAAHRSRRRRDDEAHSERERERENVTSPAAHRSRRKRDEEAHSERQKEKENVTSPAAHRSRRRREEEAYSERERERENVTSPAAHRSRRRRDEEVHFERQKERENVMSPAAYRSRRAENKFESLPVLFQQIAYLHGVTEVSDEIEKSSVPKLPALQSVPMDRASAQLVIRSVLQDRLQCLHSSAISHSALSGPLTVWKPTSSTTNTLPSEDKYLLPPLEVLQGEGSPQREGDPGSPATTEAPQGEGPPEIESHPNSPAARGKHKRSRKKVLEQHKENKVLIPQNMVDHAIKLVKRASSPRPRPEDAACEPTSKDTKQESNVKSNVKHQERELSDHEKSCIAAFHRYQEDGEIHRDCMIQALQFVGFSDPDPDWVHELCDALTTCSTLSQEEFLSLNEKYEVKRNEASKRLFEEYDPRGTGKVEVSKLREMLANFGIVPMQYVLRKVVSEVQKRYVSQSTAEFTFRQFGWIMDTLRDQENFSSEELTHFWNAFDRFDGKKTGVILTTDFQAILHWLCYILPVSAMDAIREEIGGGSPGTLNKREFLVCLRKVRDHESSCIRQVLKDHRRQAPLKLLEKVLDPLAFNPEPREISAMVEDLGLLREKKELDVDSVGEFLEAFRRIEGFAKEDADELLNWFSEFDVEGRGQVNSAQVTTMLRQMGLPISMNVARKLVATVDVHGSGDLDMSDFLKLLRAHRENEDRKAKLAFQRMAGGDEDFRVLRADKVEEALFKLGLPELPEDMLATCSNMMFCSNFVRLARKLRLHCRSDVRSNVGFSYGEVQLLQGEFQSYARLANGDVISREMHKFIEKQRPGTVSSAALRTQLIDLMAVADEEQCGSVPFDAFLRLARRCIDINEEEDLASELTAISETGFSVREVAEFRELFLGDHERKSISLVEVRQMFAKIMPMGHKNSHELSAAFSEIVPEKGGVRNASFSQFLRLMQRALDMNLGNIKEHASTAVLS